MRHFFVQLETAQRASDKTRVGDYFLKQPGTRTLRDTRGQWYELIDTEEDRHTMLIGIALCLAEGDRIGVWEIPAAQLPKEGADPVEWILERGHLGDLVTIPKLEILRRW